MKANIQTKGGSKMQHNQGRYVMRNERGFTLIELVIVIVILGIMAALAIPKFFDISGDAKKSAAQCSLGGVRSAIANYYAKSAVSGTPAYPTVAQLIDGTTVLDGVIPDNPYDTTAPKNDVEGTTSAKSTQPCLDAASAPSTKSWCYNATAGTFWANTNVVGENRF